MNRLDIEKLIVRNEWEMFQNVKGIGGRADCQDQYETFVIMRVSQFKSWPANVIESYLQDLEDAKAQERNLVMEKYAYMMAVTDPEYFASVAHLLPPVNEIKVKLAKSIVDFYIVWEKEVDIKYPNVRKHGRPAEEVSMDGTTTLFNYLICELYTYSLRTLTLLYNAIEANPRRNRYLASLEKMAQAYGYATLDEAEEALK